MLDERKDNREIQLPGCPSTRQEKDADGGTRGNDGVKGPYSRLKYESMLHREYLGHAPFTNFSPVNDSVVYHIPFVRFLLHTFRQRRK